MLLNPRIINPEAAQSLLGFLPEAEEMGIIKDYDGSLDVLDLVTYIYIQ